MPLTNEQRQHLERRLLEERAAVTRTLDRHADEESDESERDRAGDITSVPFHQADLGTDTMQQEFDAANAARGSRELAEIDAAIDRLRRTPERYGVCENTGADIPFERLDIVPWARTVAEPKGGGSAAR